MSDEVTPQTAPERKKAKLGPTTPDASSGFFSRLFAGEKKKRTNKWPLNFHFQKTRDTLSTCMMRAPTTTTLLVRERSE
jgi:hypothetical protein